MGRERATKRPRYEMGAPNLVDLPCELVAMIYEYLDDKAFCAIVCVCRALRIHRPDEVFAKRKRPHWLKADPEKLCARGVIDGVRMLRDDGHTFDVACFYDAVKNDHVDVAMLLHDGCIEMAKDSIAVNAAIYSSVGMLQALNVRGVARFKSRVLCMAASLGRLEIVLCLLQMEHYADNVRAAAKACLGAAKQDHVSVVEVLFDVYGNACLPISTIEEVAGAGRMSVVKFCLQRAPALLGEANMRSAAANGHIDILEYVHKKCPKVWLDSAVLEAAAAHGHLHIVRFMRETVGVACTERALADAFRHGHESVVLYMVCSTSDIDPALAARHALERHFIDTLCAVHKHVAFTEKYPARRTVKEAMRRNHSEAVALFGGFCTSDEAAEILCGAIKRGFSTIVALLSQIHGSDRMHHREALAAAAFSGRTDILCSFLHHCYGAPEERRWHMDPKPAADALHAATRHGHVACLDVVLPYCGAEDIVERGLCTALASNRPHMLSRLRDAVIASSSPGIFDDGTTARFASIAIKSGNVESMRFVLMAWPHTGAVFGSALASIVRMPNVQPLVQLIKSRNIEPWNAMVRAAAAPSERTWRLLVDAFGLQTVPVCRDGPLSTAPKDGGQTQPCMRCGRLCRYSLVCAAYNAGHRQRAADMVQLWEWDVEWT